MLKCKPTSLLSRNILFYLFAILLSACGGGEESPITGDPGVVIDGGSTTTALTITNLNQNNYTWGTLDIGEPVYIDRSFSYSSIPNEYIGLRYLMTRNDDKDSSNSTFISFDVSRPVSIYIAYDERITSIPSWLSTWIDTNQTITTNDATLHLYNKVFNSGTVTLGGNEGQGFSMYTVIIDAQNDNDRDGMPDDWETANGLDSTNSNDANLDADGDGYSNIVEFQGNSDPNDPTSVPDLVPSAKNDNVSITQDNTIEIFVLNNDTQLINAPINVGLMSQPANGSAVIDSNQNSILYTPNSGFTGNDNFLYSITDADGDVAIATINVKVNCNNGCAAGVDINVTWAANPANDNVQEFLVYFGTSDIATDMQEIEQLAVSTSSAELSVNYDAGNDLGLLPGEQACFRIRALNSAGLSPFSPATCGTI